MTPEDMASKCGPNQGENCDSSVGLSNTRMPYRFRGATGSANCPKGHSHLSVTRNQLKTITGRL
jgi:hypothetical protein